MRGASRKKNMTYRIPPQQIDIQTVKHQLFFKKKTLNWLTSIAIATNENGSSFTPLPFLLIQFHLQ